MSNMWPFVTREVSSLGAKLDLPVQAGKEPEAGYQPNSVDSPSGSMLAHGGIGTNWVAPYELANVCRTLYRSATTKHMDWLGTGCKYINLRIDMRTGNFIMTNDGCEQRIDGDDEILAKFGFKAPDVPLPDTNS